MKYFLVLIIGGWNLTFLVEQIQENTMLKNSKNNLNHAMKYHVGYSQSYFYISSLNLWTH